MRKRSVVVFAPDWLAASRGLKGALRKARIPFEDVDVETALGCRRRRSLGVEAVPAVVVTEGRRRVLVDQLTVDAVREWLSASRIERRRPRRRRRRYVEEDGMETTAPRRAYAALDLSFDRERAREPLRDYQEDVVRALAAKACPPSPGRRFLVSLPTGSGKTRAVNEWLVRHVFAARARVLWVTRSWELLKQAASDLCRHHEHGARSIGCVGGGLPGVVGSAQAPLVYATVQTWLARRRELARERFEYVIIDEVHWGEGCSSFRQLIRRYERTATFIGLTATPRPATDFEPVTPPLGFMDLVERGVLARPILEDAHTGVAWTPHLAHERGDFTARSLGELVRNEARNAFIVRTWVEGSLRYGKTLVFACDIDHAERLAARFRAEGVTADYVHSQLAPEDRVRVLERFRATPGGVLVNVALLTTGFDAPDVTTLFLARPTASETLFTQILGRGSRRAPGKERFHVVDFVDSLSRHRDVLVGARRFFGEQPRSGGTSSGSARGPRLRRHVYEDAEIALFPARPGYEALAGLELQPKQTFGVELELTRTDFDPNAPRPRDWRSVAEELLVALRGAVGADVCASAPLELHGSVEKDFGVWNVEPDATCGWEVTTRVLAGEEGFIELADGCRSLRATSEKLGLVVDRRTGMHVHLGWRPNAARLRRLYELVAAFEPALLSLVAASRHENPYCRSVRSSIKKLRLLETLDDWRSAFAAREARYLAVNPRNLLDASLGTLEVRLHSGTLDARKALLWTSLWMRILNAIDRDVEVPRLDPGTLPLCGGPAGDIIELVRLVGGGRAFAQALVARREACVRGSWEREGSPWRAFSERARRLWLVVG